MHMSPGAEYSDNSLVRRIARGNALLLNERVRRSQDIVDSLVRYAEQHPEVRHSIPAYYQRPPEERPLNSEGLTARLDCDGNIVSE